MARVHERLRPPVDYEEDFYSWALEQAAHLRMRRFDELDVDNVSEELEGLARSEARELRSRYATLLQHLLKWLIQPEQRAWGWVGTIRRERSEILDHLADNPGLQPRCAELFERAYRAAIGGAVADTGLPPQHFPASCPFTLEQAMDDEFWPGEPWPGFAER